MLPLRRLLTALIAALALLFLASQWRAIHTQNVNWDEFALLFRAQETVRTSALQSGQRPGLATLMLVPFARDCADAVSAIVSARTLWLGFTLGHLAAVAGLVLAFAPRTAGAGSGALLAVGLLALVPVFMRWSLQVRADQPALMFACWGGVLLLLSHRQAWRAAAAGVLFAIGYVCSQKAAYPIAMAMMLFGLQLAPGLNLRAVDWRRGLRIIALAGSSALLTLTAYRLGISLLYDPPAAMSVQRSLNLFVSYRAIFGYRAYAAMLPTLLAHLALAGLALAVLVISWRRTLAARAAILACCLTLLLGLLVGWFHAAAFPYFWMTLGTFPAVALGIGWPSIADALGRTAARVVLASAAAVLLASAIPAAAMLRDDTQRVQRDALAFIDRNFASSARGFQAEGALACRRDPNPFPIYFADSVAGRLAGPSREAAARTFIDEFRSRPVAFIIAHRLFTFPGPIEQFWRDHYVLYRDEVMIPGRRVSGRRGEALELDVIVPGLYQWRPATGVGAALAFGDVMLGAGGTIALDLGTHRFTLLGDAPAGLLTLAIRDEPRPGGQNFYDPLVIHELDPLYPREIRQP